MTRLLAAVTAVAVCAGWAIATAGHTLSAASVMMEGLAR